MPFMQRRKLCDPRQKAGAGRRLDAQGFQDEHGGKRDTIGGSFLRQAAFRFDP